MLVGCTNEMRVQGVEEENEIYCMCMCRCVYVCVKEKRKKERETCIFMKYAEPNWEFAAIFPNNSTN